MEFNDWILSQINTEKYWFHRIDLNQQITTPGWSDAKIDKLPYFGLPSDMSGMRVLDIGHAEGFFSFEAERRGAAEIVGIDNYPPMNHKFNLCKYAQNSKANSYMASVYDLDPKKFGTFDIVFFFGVLYHLRNPILALEKIASICTGTILVQTAICSNTSEIPMAEFHPFGLTIKAGDTTKTDPTCFWFPNTACVNAMLEHTGFKDIEQLSKDIPSVGAVFRAKSPTQSPGIKPDENKAPWS
jgi:tRNA (mo5U34)-methyltransferase